MRLNNYMEGRGFGDPYALAPVWHTKLLTYYVAGVIYAYEVNLRVSLDWILRVSEANLRPSGLAH